MLNASFVNSVTKEICLTKNEVHWLKKLIRSVETKPNSVNAIQILEY